MSNPVKLIIFASSFCFLSPSFAQRSSDLGVKISTNSTNQIALEYRIPTAEKSYWRLGASYGIKSNGGLNYAKVVAATDTSYTERRYIDKQKWATVRFGIGKQLKSSFFSFTVDALLAYTNWRSDYNNQTIKTPVSSPSQNIQYWEPIQDPQPTLATRHYILPGAQMGLALNVPISNRLLFNASASASVQSGILVDQSIETDPLNEVNQRHLEDIVANGYLSLGVRYKFAKPTSPS